MRWSFDSINSPAQNHSEHKSFWNNKYSKEKPIQEPAGSFPWNFRTGSKLSVITCKVEDTLKAEG